jgi:hypothetical protein
LRLRVFARNFIPKSPTNYLSEPEHTNPKTFVEIFNSVEQKPFPLTPSFPSINQNPTNSQFNTEHPNPKNVEKSEIDIKKIHHPAHVPGTLKHEI